jgi:hypothetical protein
MLPAAPTVRLSSVLLAPFEVLAVVWLIPVVILAIGAPIALLLKLLLYLAGIQ